MKYGFLARHGASPGTYYVANLSSFSQGKLEVTEK